MNSNQNQSPIDLIRGKFAAIASPPVVAPTAIIAADNSEKISSEKNAMEILFFGGELNSGVESVSTRVDAAGPIAVATVAANDPDCPWCGGEDCECVCRPVASSQAVVESGRPLWWIEADGRLVVADVDCDSSGFNSADYFFPLISPADRLHLATKIDQSMCGFCGGRGGRHNPVCCTLRDDWFSVMPWGKHKGENLAAMAKTKEGSEYLKYLLKVGRVSGDLREDVERVLGVEVSRKQFSESEGE